MALHGVDLSHHNDPRVFDVCMDEEDFIILKATEGRTYKDPTFDFRQNHLILGDRRRGYYHYARPENNSPEEEARNFLTTIGEDAKYAILVLDWEGKALRHDFKWALAWIEYIKSHVKNSSPILYASASVIRKYSDLIIKNDISVWTAHYNDACANGCVHDGGVVELMTQYTSYGVDRNIFHDQYWESWTADGNTVTGLTPITDKVAEWEEADRIYEVICRKKG